MRQQYDNTPVNENEYYETSRVYRNDNKGPGLVAKLAAAAVAFVYLGSPVDLIPDFIPVLGQVDDITALYLAYRYIFMNRKS